jgi:chromosomal replication initiation ATPase DnaA
MIPFNDILDAVAFECDCQVRDLTGRGRHRRLVLGRELVVELARRHTVMSYPEIADGLGRKSHSVAVAAHNRIRTRLTGIRPTEAGRWQASAIRRIERRMAVAGQRQGLLPS